MKVLIACEFSGIVRDAFLIAGHDAISVDLLPSESDYGPHHIGDVFDFLMTADRDGDRFDLMIAHPPCTYLANSGVRWLYHPSGYRDDARWESMRHGATMFRDLLTWPTIPRVAVENPIMHRYGMEIIGARASQFVQPWQFGHGETKAVGLWLRGLPTLVPTNVVPGRKPRVHFASPGPERWRERSRFYPGIAPSDGRAMGIGMMPEDYAWSDSLAAEAVEYLRDATPNDIVAMMARWRGRV